MTEALSNIVACVFEAFGTLFDVNGAVEKCQTELGDKWQPLTEQWRAKRLQYTWLRSLMDEYEGFWKVTEDALGLRFGFVGH